MNADKTLQWDWLTPEELEELVAEHRAHFDFEAATYADQAGLERLLEYLQLLIYLREVEEARLVMPHLKAGLDEALAARPDNEELLGYAIEWNGLAMPAGASP